MKGVESRLDGTTLVVRIPMRFQRRGGRKRIVAPDGGDIVLTSKPQRDGTPVKALARAWQWQRMLEDGEFGTVQDLAQVEKINPSYVSRVLRLTLLAPEVVEAILDGRQPLELQLKALLKQFPAQWEEQRAFVGLSGSRGIRADDSAN
jgi:hypothetical protein